MTNYRAIFEQSPGNFIVVDPTDTIVAVTDGYLRMTMRTRDGLVGANIYEAFPDDPSDPNARGTAVLRSGIEQAIASRETAWLPSVQRYPIPRPAEQGGGFEERYFRAVNAPVIDDSGDVVYVIHGNEDVTATVLAGDSGAETAPARSAATPDSD
jgi:PAS domain-containing protein